MTEVDIYLRTDLDEQQQKQGRRKKNVRTKSVFSQHLRRSKMNIDTQEVLRYIESQKTIFTAMPLASDFNDGIVEGLNLVKTFLKIYEERLGDAIAEHHKEREREE